MEPEKKSNGAFVGLAVIIIILIIGGIYMWQAREDRLEVTEPGPVSTEDSTSLDALEAELESTDTETGVDVNTVN